MNKLQNITKDKNFELAIMLSLIDEAERQEKLLPEIPKEMKIPAITYGMSNKRIFYNYCQDIHKKINNLLLLTIIDVKNEKYFSKRNKYFKTVLLSENTLQAQLRILSSEKSSDTLYDFMYLFCKENDILVTPMSVLLIRSSFKFHKRLNDIFSGINYFWIKLFEYLYSPRILDKIIKD